jgi:long-subunit fatty acid transport protein
VGLNVLTTTNKNSKLILYSFSLLLFFILTFPSSPLAANDASELLLQMQIRSSPNPVGSGARALGMGGSFIAIADDATAASWNPAALIILKRPEISFVIANDHGKRIYDTSAVSGSINDFSNDQLRLNYLSLALPFSLFSRLMVFSMNYQHLYTFSYEEQSQWSEYDPGVIDLEYNLHEKQKGVLAPLSPALAIQVVPSLSLGITANIWSHRLFNNYWENISTISGKGMAPGYPMRSFGQLYERYEFSGLNFHLGFLWQITRRFKIGGVIKTPFRARIDHTLKYVYLSENLEDRADSEYIPFSYHGRSRLNMPVSYGAGVALGFLDNYLLFSLDVYRTHWDDYLMITSSGRYSPINYKPEREANIKPTTQIRFGAEYLLFKKGRHIPLRSGIFYDPEPAEGGVDDFFGASIGTGIAGKDFAFDIAYQYRFGEKRGIEGMLGKRIGTKVKQHSIYSSIIFYF